MKRTILALGSAASLLLSSGAMAAPAKKGGEASCSCSDHKAHASKGKKQKGTCPHCGMKECSCSKEACAKCEHCQEAKAEGKKEGSSCGHDEEKSEKAAAPAPEAKDAKPADAK